MNLRLEEMTAEVRDYRKALEWYSQEHVYAITQRKEPRSAVHADGGNFARRVLDKWTPEYQPNPDDGSIDRF